MEPESKEPRTQEDLKRDWGQKRFVDAMLSLSSWYQKYGVPQSVEEIKKLLVEKPDAWELFKARTWDESTKLLAELNKEKEDVKDG